MCQIIMLLIIYSRILTWVWFLQNLRNAPMPQNDSFAEEKEVMNHDIYVDFL